MWLIAHILIPNMNVWLCQTITAQFRGLFITATSMAKKTTSLFSSQRRALTLEPFFIIATGKAKRERFTHNVRCTLYMKLMWFISYPSNVINRCPVLFYFVFCYLFIIHAIVVGCCVVNEYSMACFDISPENTTLCCRIREYIE